MNYGGMTTENWDLDNKSEYLYIIYIRYWGRDVSRAAAREVVPQTLCLWQ